jgi:RNA polymerase sigma-70 factor (ECF subfamily)
MIAAFRRAGSFRGDAAVTTWLYRIVVNAALDRMRRQAARRAALSTLVPDLRAALVLVDMLGYSMADAAQVLSVSEGTVKSRAARGRARLLPRLAHLHPAVPGQGGGSRPRAPGTAAVRKRGDGPS